MGFTTSEPIAEPVTMEDRPGPLEQVEAEHAEAAADKLGRGHGQGPRLAATRTGEKRGAGGQAVRAR